MPVVPHLESGNPAAVFFPDLSYTPEFWSGIARVHDYSPASAAWPGSLVSAIKSSLAVYPSVSPPADLLAEWGSRSPQFFRLLPQFFSPGLMSSVREFVILFTPFGTLGSFSSQRHSDGSRTLICSSRIDFPVTNTFNVITQSLILTTQSGCTDLGTVGYHQRLAVLDYLTRQTDLGPLITFPPPVPLSPQLLSTSRSYLTRLGFPPDSAPQLSQLTQSFTPLESRLFACLVRNQNSVVSFDDAATAVWRDQVETKYSLYALAKLVENLRRKIRSSGTSRDVILTFRGRGYMLIA